MKCPYCNQENTRVIDSRPAEDNNSIRRRRECDECGKRFISCFVPPLHAVDASNATAAVMILLIFIFVLFR